METCSGINSVLYTKIITKLEFYMSNVVPLVKNREGWLVSDHERECTNCRGIYKRTSKTVTLCPLCNTTRVKENSPEAKMLTAAKGRARLAQMECTIELADIVIPELCPIMGYPLQRHVGTSGGRPNSPSLDRIDNTKGYTPDNIQVISHLANQMKSSATPKQMKKFADWVYRTYKDTDND